MLFRLIILFTVVPLTELFLLMWLAEVTNSAAMVFGLVILTGIVGASLARWQGAGTWRRLHRDLNAGRMPADALLDGLLIFIAGALLLTPGILTDLVGFGLLIPPLRSLLKRFLVWRFKSRFEVIARDMSAPGARGPGAQRDEIIESRLIDPQGD
jgi:UPF0716 protein FxsA